MAMEKALYEADPLSPEAQMEPGEDIEIEIVNPDAVSLETEDGGMIFDFSGGKYDQGELDSIPFNANLAEYLDEDELNRMAGDLLASFEADKNSRRVWERAYQKGLDLLGLKIEERTDPWPGACGVFHPVLAEAVVRFQAHSVTETLPASGPVRTKIVGKSTKEIEDQAARVRDDLNYLTTEEMEDYRDEHERVLFNLALAGSAFKKGYFDEAVKSPAMVYVSAENLVVPYGVSSLAKSPRITHVMPMYENDVIKLQKRGFWRDIELTEPAPVYSESQDKEDKITGIEATMVDDDRFTIYEMHVDIDLPAPFNDPDGIGRPHIVTFTAGGEVLAVRRNWREGDPEQKKRMWFTHYKYLPGLGFYGIGLIHLIGGLTKSGTSILRQLVDAGTLSNLPAGYKARGMRVRGDDTPLKPGEFRDVDIPGDNIRNALLPLPYKEPSVVLYQLLGTVTEEARRIGSIADINLNDTNKETPVGTTMAMLERSLKIMGAVQARIHAAMKQELKILVSIVRDNMPPEYPFDVGGNYTRTEDYDDRVDVIPVSDPNASTMAMKVIQYQAAIQIAQTAPHLYNEPKLHRGMLDALQIKGAEDLVPLDEDHKPKDPVAENMAILKGEPVKAFAYQDHEAHIMAHMAAAQDPKIQEMVAQNPKARSIAAALQAHVTEHVAYQYRKEIEKALGTPLPNTEDTPLPQDVELQLSSLVAKAADKVLKKDQQEMQMRKNQQMMDDPILQMQMRELAIKERKQQADEMIAKAELQLKGADIQSDEQIEGAKLAVKMAELEAKSRSDGVRMAMEWINKLSDVDQQEKNRIMQGLQKEAELNERRYEADQRDRQQRQQSQSSGVSSGANGQGGS